MAPETTGLRMRILVICLNLHHVQAGNRRKCKGRSAYRALYRRLEQPARFRLYAAIIRQIFGKPEGSSLASLVRKKVTVFLLDRFDEREQCTVRNASNAR